MSTASNLTNLNAAITLLLNMTVAAGKVSAAITAAQAEGRDLLDSELEALQATDDAARADLVGAIEASRQPPA
jgi:hypothetical protein